MLTSDYIGAVHHAAAQATAREQQAQHAAAHNPSATASTHTHRHARSSTHLAPGSLQQQQFLNDELSAHTSQTSLYTLAADAFCQSVLPAHTDLTIAKSHLLRLLEAYKPSPLVTPQPQKHTLSATYQAAKSSQASPDELLTRLLHMGAVGRHATDDNVYVLSIPGAGSIIKSITAGAQGCLLPTIG